MILGGNPIIDAFQIIRGGKIEGMARASMVLPEPGGPVNKTL